MTTRDLVEELKKQGYSQNEIAEHLGISRQRVHQIIKEYKNFGRRGRAKKYRDFGLCEACELNTAEVLHHKDLNNSNDDVSNLEKLCRNCHLLRHKKNEITMREQLIGLLELEPNFTAAELAKVFDTSVEEMEKMIVKVNAERIFESKKNDRSIYDTTK